MVDATLAGHLPPGALVENDDLFLNCLRRTVDVFQRGTFNRWESVAFMATCIDVHHRQMVEVGKAEAEVRDPAGAPKLGLSEPLNEDDQVLQELYAEAITFWSAGFGKLKLIK